MEIELSRTVPVIPYRTVPVPQKNVKWKSALTFLRYGMGSVRDGTFGHVSMRITKKSRSDIDPIPFRPVPTKVELSSTFQRYGTGSTRDSILLANQRRVSLVFID